MQPYQEHLTIRNVEVGTDHLVRLQTLFNYMEEAAGNHAEILGCGLDSLQQQNMTWVLAKMKVVLHSLAPAGTDVVVTTWPAGLERLTFRRDFIVTCAQTKQPILSATSFWAIMNTETRRLERMPDWASGLIAPDIEPALQENNIRIPAVAYALNGANFTIRMADIDQNQHVNNVRYVDFVLEAAHLYQQQHNYPHTSLQSIALVYKAEAVYGDCVEVVTQGSIEEGALILSHSLYTKNGTQEIVRVTTQWHSHH